MVLSFYVFTMLHNPLDDSAASAGSVSDSVEGPTVTKAPVAAPVAVKRPSVIEPMEVIDNRIIPVLADSVASDSGFSEAHDDSSSCHCAW